MRSTTFWRRLTVTLYPRIPVDEHRLWPVFEDDFALEAVPYVVY
jgi:hypothetical protein